MEHFRKVWPAEFSKDDRKASENRPQIEENLEIAVSGSGSLSEDTSPLAESSGTQTSLEVEPNHLEHFLPGCADDNPSSAEQEILEFCNGVHQSCLTQDDRDQRKTSWVDDRTYSYYRNHSVYPPPLQQVKSSYKNRQGPPARPNNALQDSKLNDDELPFRKYQSLLTARGLSSHLKEKQFEHSELPDADRRLISIVNLSPQMVFALTETALPHQAPSLIDGVFNHLALQTCMGVNISLSGFKVFRLRFHVPFYLLREAPPKEYMKDEVFTKPRRKYRDVSFLARGRPASPTETPLGIHESHISITVCGVANCRWTAYCFRDSDFEDDEEMTEEDFDYESVIPDQIAGDDDVDANCPIFSPREYFLTVVSKRLRRVVDEWAKLVRAFEHGIVTDSLPSIKTPSPEHEDETTFDLTQKARLTLWELHDELSRITEVWKQFSSTNGDISYFHDSQDGLAAIHGDGQKLVPWVLEIQSEFDELDGLKRRLYLLAQSCERRANLLELRLLLDSNKSTKFSGAITELMITWVSPAALVSAFFAIPEPFGGFPRTGSSFAWGYLVVFVVLQFLVFGSKGLIKPEAVWQRCKPMVTFFSNGEDLRERFGGMRRRRLPRTDTETTLVTSDVTAP